MPVNQEMMKVMVQANMKIVVILGYDDYHHQFSSDFNTGTNKTHILEMK